MDISQLILLLKIIFLLIFVAMVLCWFLSVIFTVPHMRKALAHIDDPEREKNIVAMPHRLMAAIDYIVLIVANRGQKGSYISNLYGGDFSFRALARKFDIIISFGAVGGFFIVFLVGASAKLLEYFYL